MIIVLAGVTGVGKSYLKQEIQEQLGFQNMTVVTTREKRKGEKDGIDKHFVTQEKFQKWKEQKEIVVPFTFLGNEYAYFTKDVTSNQNKIVELHYSVIYQFKK